ncbi:aromatic acid/H+ symport family MFS transporter [Glutamicibacter sp. PS]|uniref:MFS transporter n=1 Tax=Glutamicibacter sp. PS TaxID=3075634 RepID=UPI002848D66D|nr:aromatic acid/H+ symport family MFS transporter [Glutamicibacter sp. PS]MDR4534208.1 aromatic acid/H+ symport family MFS transporter [Glutamicibacter sp. PS]
MSTSPENTNTLRISGWIATLCFLIVVFEGYDIVALGATIPVLTDPQVGGYSVSSMNWVNTFSLIGVGIGAAIMGRLADRFGRRRPLLIAVLVFSVFTLAFPFMPSAVAMGAVRLIAGLGLGGCMPVALALMQENAPVGRRALANNLPMVGYHLGAVLASLAGKYAGIHWSLLYYLGGGLGLLLLALLWFKLPDSPVTPSAERTGIAQVLAPRYLRSSIGLWIAAFMGLVLVYGLNAWLPKIMSGAGYPVADSLTMLFVLNLGAITGLFISAFAADAKGIKLVSVLWFAASAVLLVLLAIPFGSQIVLTTVIFVTGIFVFSAQCLMYVYAGHIYPRDMVATGIGLASGIGRFGAIIGPYLTGLMVAAGTAYPGAFFLYGGAALVAVVVIAQIPKPSRDVAGPAS